MCFSVPVHALDNPDAPSYVNDFMKRADIYEQKIQHTTHSTHSYITAYATYEQFLDEELNSAYNQLIKHLNDEAQQVLKDSQRQWLKYRNAEFNFIAHNWTTKTLAARQHFHVAIIVPSSSRKGLLPCYFICKITDHTTIPAWIFHHKKVFRLNITNNSVM